MEDAKKTYKLLPCKTEDYKKYVDVLNEIFNKKEEEWFLKYMPHIFPAVGEREHLVPYSMYFLDGEEIMSTIGIYPLKMQVSYGDKSTVLDIGGIGSVGTVSEYRGMGLMSQMLNQVNEKLYDDGYDVSWLGGDRYRYKNYGWDISGRVVNFTLNLRDLNRLYSSVIEGKVVKAELEHIDMLDSLYTNYSSRILRSKELWTAQFPRKGVEFSILMDEENNAKSYILYSPQAPDKIKELQGDEESIVSLIVKHMQKHELDNVTIVYPYNDDKLFKLLHRICANYNTGNLMQMKVVNVESTWDKLQPLIREQVIETKSDKLLELFDSIETCEEKKAILEITFGSFETIVELPDRLASFKVLKPLNWWLPIIDFV